MVLLSDFVSHPKFPDRYSDYIRWYPKSLQSYGGEADGFSLGRRANPNGVYIHVPFCDQLCRFCPFNKKKSNSDEIARYFNALLQEIRMFGALCAGSDIEFVYFGGGTPSVLNPSQVAEIHRTLQANFKFRQDVEVTMECHPLHCTKDYLVQIRRAGVTRISSGIQSFDDAMLGRNGGFHNAADAVNAVGLIVDAFGTVAIDLLFRCPGQTLPQWERELENAVSMRGVEHISLYSLVLKSDREQPSLAVEAEMTVLAHRILGSAGFEHYASCASGGFDFAKAGRRCVYEARHWGAPQAQFLGLGPGALGYIGGATTVNGLGVASYCSALEENLLPLASVKYASAQEAMRRFFVLGVKTLAVPFPEFVHMFGIDPRSLFASEFEWLRQQDFAAVTQDALVLTELGALFVDSISAVFFSAEEANVPHPEEPEIRRIELQRRGRLERSIP